MNNEQETDNLPAVVTVESLKESHGDEGVTLYHRISQIGGFGDFSRGDFIGGCPPLGLNGLQTEARREVRDLLAAKIETPITADDPRLNRIPADAPRATGAVSQENDNKEDKI